MQIFWKIEFPASMPALMAGLRIGATLAVIGVTVGELVGGNTGLGYLITYGEGQANAAMVFNAIMLTHARSVLCFTPPSAWAEAIAFCITSRALCANSGHLETRPCMTDTTPHKTLFPEIRPEAVS